MTGFDEGGFDFTVVYEFLKPLIEVFIFIIIKSIPVLMAGLNFMVKALVFCMMQMVTQIKIR